MLQSSGQQLERVHLGVDIAWLRRYLDTELLPCFDAQVVTDPRLKSDQERSKRSGDRVRRPGIEPGSQEWESCMIPLHQRRADVN